MLMQISRGLYDRDGHPTGDLSSIQYRGKGVLFKILAYKGKVLLAISK